MVSASQVITRWSMSLPPRCASPSVERTSMTSSPTSRTDMSKVPPPKSNTTIFSFFFLLKPYARAAAVGSLMMRFTSSPAILPASRVACLCAFLKYQRGNFFWSVPFIGHLQFYSAVRGFAHLKGHRFAVFHYCRFIKRVSDEALYLVYGIFRICNGLAPGKQADETFSRF